MIGERFVFIRQLLAPVSETASLDVQVLLAHILQKPRAWVLAHPEALLTLQQERVLDQAVQRLQAGEPLPYVLGEWEFYGLPFIVTPAVLIPRPETELLVDYAIQWLERRPELLRCLTARLAVLDVGTGSGCIAVALAARLPGLKIAATDLSPSALEVARRNTSRHQVAAQICLLQSDLLSAFSPQPTFHLICANLPYIPQETLPNLPVYSREPALALDGGSGGLTLLRQLLHQAVSCLAPGGLLLLEIEASQGQVVPALARQVFSSAAVDLHRDLAGCDRLVSIHLPL
jgi:release factor glutamine methyltransferase